ncbi:hypothetical protein Tco_1086200 [Tanacetum coccineum]
MSDSEHSIVTYTSVPFPVEDDSDIGSPGIDGPPIMPEDPYAYIMAAYEVPPSPDYIPGPEIPPSPDYIPGPESRSHLPPLDLFRSRCTLSTIHRRMRYSPPRAATTYCCCLTLQIQPDIEEEEEHPALADSIPPVHRMTARISIRDEPSISLPPREECRQSAFILEFSQSDHRRQRVISELLASDHKRQVQLTKTLRLLKGLQTQMVEFQRQSGPAKGPAQPDAPGEAGCSS